MSGPFRFRFAPEAAERTDLAVLGFLSERALPRQILFEGRERCARCAQLGELELGEGKEGDSRFSARRMTIDESLVRLGCSGELAGLAEFLGTRQKCTGARGCGTQTRRIYLEVV